MYTNSSFDTGVLRMRLKAAEDKVKAFESGRKYVQLQDKYQSIIREKERMIRGLKRELAKAHAQTVNVRNMWFENL